MLYNLLPQWTNFTFGISAVHPISRSYLSTRATDNTFLKGEGGATILDMTLCSLIAVNASHN